jgi:hypothetical protein
MTHGALGEIRIVNLDVAGIGRKLFDVLGGVGHVILIIVGKTYTTKSRIGGHGLRFAAVGGEEPHR